MFTNARSRTIRTCRSFVWTRRPKQLVSETRRPLAMKPGTAGTSRLRVRTGRDRQSVHAVRAAGGLSAHLTDRRTAIDYAKILKDLSDIHFPQARKIVLVQDNLNAHAKASLYEAFAPAEAPRLAERFEWHYTPKHGSWPNMAESELGVLPRNAWTAASPTSRRPHGKTAATNIRPRPIGDLQPPMPVSS